MLLGRRGPRGAEQLLRKLIGRCCDQSPRSGNGDERRGQSMGLQYERIGLKRKRYLLSLKKDDRLKAVFMVMVSDVGLNMSNLTNCVHVFRHG